MHATARKTGEVTLHAALVGAFVLLILSFFASSAYSFYVSAGVGEASQQIAHNASPSVLRLTSARTELRRLESAVHQLLGRQSSSPSEDRELEALQAKLEAELAAYRSLPLDSGEEVLAEQIEQRRRELRDAITQTLALSTKDREGARGVAETRITPVVDALDEAMKSAAEVNAQNAKAQAERINELRQKGKRTELLLDVLSAVFGLVLLVVLLRILTRYTRLLRAQTEELEARAGELNDFSGRVAHDIRGPLASLSLALQMAEQSAQDDSTRDLVARGLRSLQRATGIIDTLYEFARSGAKPEPGSRCDAWAVLGTLLEELAPAAKDAKVELSLDARTDARMACSDGVLTSIAGNLARNAIKYIGEGETRRVTLRLTEAGERLRLEVEDTGPGIPEALRPVLFEPHARAPGTKQPGLGLGLATVKRLVTAHGGEVSVVESAPGKGTCFRVELPKA
ncbi:MAG TPA: ATP-binding protein [Myxococcaceae bacterium]|nr:ATP-binding protein [Myxococcaceae bacterium]